MLHRRFWTAFVNSLFSGSAVDGHHSRRQVQRNGKVLRRNAGWKSRLRSTDVLEDRTVLTPLTGIDFGGGAVPTNWASYSGSSNSTLTNLINEDGIATGFNAVITRDSIPGGPSNFTPQPSTLPQHTQSLAGIDRIYQDQFGNIQLNWGGLTPGASYEVYVFGGNEGTGNPRVTITGATEIQFGQAHQANQLMVNDQVGESSRTLSSYAKIMNANASGNILVRVDSVFQSFFGTAGMAIRPAAAAPGFTVTPISGNTNEAESSATFSVKLNTQPAADVTISLSSDDTTEGTVTQSSLTFTSANWNTPQVVTVTGVDDTVDDDDVVYQIITSAASSTDLDYNGLNPVDVTVTNSDDDTQSLITSAGGITVAEGSTNTFTVRLGVQPVGDVTVNVNRSSGDTSLSVVGVQYSHSQPSTGTFLRR